MPKPIVCLSEQLRQYLEAFRPCFSKRQWKYFVTALLGLFECEERKVMTRLPKVVGGRISLSGTCTAPQKLDTKMMFLSEQLPIQPVERTIDVQTQLVSDSSKKSGSAYTYRHAQ